MVKKQLEKWNYFFSVSVDFSLSENEINADVKIIVVVLNMPYSHIDDALHPTRSEFPQFISLGTGKKIPAQPWAWQKKTLL